MGCSDSGSEIEETLPNIIRPTVKTLEAANITEITASIEGNVTGDGGAPITEKGVCWATSSKPTLENNFTKIGGGKGSYTNQLNDLEENTTYYVRAYATNKEGTSFGNEISFTTLEKPALVYEGSKTLLTQEMVDDFGDQNYTEITGDLTIAYDINHPEWERPHNLDKLSSLSTIGGSLFIYGLEKLSSTDGLANITSVGADIEIIGSKMTSLTFLKGIKVYNGSFTLSRVGSLQSLNGLENCTKINGNLTINFNSNLTDIDALMNLSSIEGHLNIDYNEVLPNLNGLGGLTEVGRFLQIARNDMLIDISGLHSLEKVKWIFAIHHCPLLTNINGLDKLLQVEGVEIIENEALINLDGLQHVMSNQGIQEKLIIRNNNSLINIDILELITDMSDLIEIRGNESLKNLNGLDNLKTIGFLDIGNNKGLTEIAGLNNLISITKGLKIDNNDNLTKISGFKNISSFEGTLKIWYNGMLSDLCGLAPIFDNGLVEGKYQVSGNNYNPSYQDFIDGKCNK